MEKQWHVTLMLLHIYYEEIGWCVYIYMDTRSQLYPTCFLQTKRHGGTTWRKTKCNAIEWHKCNANKWHILVKCNINEKQSLDMQCHWIARYQNVMPLSQLQFIGSLADGIGRAPWSRDGNMGHCFSTKWLKISHCQPFWMRSHAGSPLGTSMACPFSGMQPCWMALKNAVVWEAERLR